MTAIFFFFAAPKSLPLTSSTTTLPSSNPGDICWMSAAHHQLEPFEEEQRDPGKTGSSGRSEEVSDDRHAALRGACVSLCVNICLNPSALPGYQAAPLSAWRLTHCG